jgi:uncharacterized membrane protein
MTITTRRAGISQFVRSETSDLRQVRRFTVYSTRQNILAGMNPIWAVLNPMMQMIMLLIAASTQPSQHLRPTRIVETMVKTHDT